MLVSEFIDRTGYQPTAEEYAEIERAYSICETFRVSAYITWNKYDGYVEAIIN